MTKSKTNERLSVDVPAEEHRQIKIQAARRGLSIRLYVLEGIRQKLAQDQEEEQALQAMTMHPSPVLKQLWANEKDAAYDHL